MEAERETFRTERDQALSKVCPDPSRHTLSTNNNSNGSDIPIIISTDPGYNNTSNTPPNGQKDFFQKLISAFMKWFK